MAGAFARTARSALRLAFGLVLASCNTILGLDPVHLLPDDAGAGGTGGVATGTGGAGGGTGGASGGTGGRAGTGGRGPGTGGGVAAGTGGNAAGSGGARGGTGGSSGSCGQDLVLNGALDYGSVVWTEVPIGTVLIRRDDDPELTTIQMVSPYSPRYLAELGGVKGSVVTYLEQDVVVPADARELTFTGWVLIKTGEPPLKALDFARAELDFDPAHKPTFVNWSNLDATDTWTQYSGTLNVSAMAGMDVTFRLYAEDNDNEIVTYFFFDSVSLTVSACGP